MNAALPRCLAALALGLATAVAGAAAAADRPRVGLVLGGGGARGAAHIGVLEVLEQQRVTVDCIAGTSFGALVAGAWAAGVSPAQMRRAMAEADWPAMFQDDPPYDELDHRRKRLLQRYLPGSELGVGAGGVTAPPGAVGGQKIKLFINSLVRADRGEIDIANLPVPLSIVATDIGSGDRVVFRDGSLTAAMRASMAVPGLVAPAEVGGRRLVDGGLVDNLPIQEVRERCGAEVVIAVNVGSPLLAPQDVGSLLTVTAQMIVLLTEQNVTRSLQALRPGDIYLRPVLDGIGAGDFARHEDAVTRGRAAAGFVADALARLAVDESSWAAWLQARADVDRRRPWVQEVQIEGLQRAGAEVVERHLTQTPDTPLDTARLQRDLMRVYGDGWYQSVDYSLLTLRDRNVLRILPVEKAWGPDYLRLAIHLDSTLDQGSAFGLRAAVQKTWLNRLGGELLLQAGVGSRSGVDAQWYQPLVADQRWFAQVDLGLGSILRDLYVGDDRLSRYTVQRAAAELSLGTNLDRTGQLRAGWRATAGRVDLDTGLDLLPTRSAQSRGLVLAVDLDRMDRLTFPTRGWSVQLEFYRPSDEDYARLATDLRLALPFEAWVFGARAAYTGSTQGLLPLFDAGTLGGFLNLSAYGTGQFVADTVRYAHLRAERIIGRLPLGLRGDMRLGLAIEAGRTGGRYTGDARGGLLESLTTYLGGETPFGPVYVGLGFARGGATNAYLVLGAP
jgi:NTE family protein